MKITIEKRITGPVTLETWLKKISGSIRLTQIDWRLYEIRFYGVAPRSCFSAARFTAVATGETPLAAVEALIRKLNERRQVNPDVYEIVLGEVEFV